MVDESSFLAYVPLWQDQACWYWFAAGLALLALEVAVDGTFFTFFPLGIGALVVGGVNWFAPDLAWQFDAIILAVTALVFAVIIRRYLPRRGDGTTLNAVNEQLVGQTLVLEEPIFAGRGRISLRGSLWLVRGPDLGAGTRVRVTGREGNYLKVVPDQE